VGALKDQLQMLLELQKLDLKRDEIRSGREAIDGNLAEITRVLDQLRDDLENQAAQLDATIQLHAEKTAEHQDSEDRYKKSKGRLSKVSNTKEYSAIELEIENAKKQAAQLEEELAQLSAAIETSRQAASEKEAKIADLSEQVNDETRRAQQRLSELERQLGDLMQNRNGVAKDISKEVIRRYTFIRSRRDGVAIVAARNGCCQGCFMQLPPQMYIELQRGDTLTSCPSCQRILFFIDAPEGTRDSTAE
jgi:predicted  nucleic acid-binding Zn-ribbon protein